MEPHNTELILDLRDRMARIETKLDGHYEAHVVVDRRLDRVELSHTGLAALIAANHESLSTRITANKLDIDTNKTRIATVATIAGGGMALLTFLGDHFWKLFS